MKALLASLVVFALGPGCSSSPDSPVSDELAAARRQWSGQRPSSYSFTWHRECECGSETVRPTRITIASGAISSAVYVDNQQAVSAQIRSSLATIDGVFDLIEDAIDQDAHEITVSFDPARGYPSSLYVDYRERTADEELSLQLSDFQTPAAAR